MKGDKNVTEERRPYLRFNFFAFKCFLCYIFFMNKSKTSQEYSFTVIYTPIKGGGYQVSVPLLSGVISYGRTIEEAKTMARDAILCHIEGLKKERELIPRENSFFQERLTVSFS